jgi:hypothetical protein
LKNFNDYTQHEILVMIYYEYIFYKTYLFFFRRSAQDMPGVKAILLTGFVVVFTLVLLADLLLNVAGDGLNQLFSLAMLKFLIVSLILSLWLANYYLFWRNGRLLVVLQKFEEQTAAYNQVAASLVTATFFLLPIILFIILAVRGAHSRN